MLHARACAIAALFLSACGPDKIYFRYRDAGRAPAPEYDAGVPDACVEPPASTDLDILFVIDDSGGMAMEQARLAESLAGLLSALASGDKEAGKEQPRADAYAGRHFIPPRSLHIGVVTSSLGVPPGIVDSVSAACAADNGRNAVLASSGRIASQDQLDVNTNTLIVPGQPACADVNLAPPYIAFQTLGEQFPLAWLLGDQAASQARCIATVGVGGCGLEQPLEAMWKALAPLAVADFVGPDTQGQGDRQNAGFLRSESKLVVVLLSDEDDCSLTARGAPMAERNAAAGVPAVNVRCALLQDDPVYADQVWPTARYVDGLLGLRAHRPDQLLMLSIVGIPTTASSDAPDFTDLLANPAMEVRIDDDAGTAGTELVPACTAEDGSERAYPGRRYVEVAAGLELAGATALIGSTCSPSYAPHFERLVDSIAEQLGEGCP